MLFDIKYLCQINDPVYLFSAQPLLVVHVQQLDSQTTYLTYHLIQNFTVICSSLYIVTYALYLSHRPCNSIVLPSEQLNIHVVQQLEHLTYRNLRSVISVQSYKPSLYQSKSTQFNSSSISVITFCLCHFSLYLVNGSRPSQS